MSDVQSELAPLYRAMFLIRRFEEEAARAYMRGKIGGFLHLYIGQEAVAVGVEAAIEKTDYVIATYRDHGVALARGTSARAVMAELFGRETGIVRGLGGSMHLFDAEHRLLGGHAIVGSHMPVAAGVAFRSKYVGEQSVVVCFLGEGATNIGGFHEALSLSALWKLPIVFVCENNLYSMGTPLERTSALEDITLKAAGYGMASARFEGKDVLSVRDGMRASIERARAGEGATLIEVMTYRFHGHSMSDPGAYRTKEELERHKRDVDPCRLSRQRLLDAGMPEQDLLELDRSVEEEVADAVRFADESPVSARENITRFVYAPSSSDQEQE
jgi:pyruvate dehydrogenase E1 component alpha subunit